MKYLPQTAALAFIGFILLSFSTKQTQDRSYIVDSHKSAIKWTGYYLFSFADHFGSVDLAKGELRIDKVEHLTGFFEIDMKSIQNLDMPTDDGGKDLTEHLRSKDFFDVDQFPVARFEITKSEKIKDNRSNEPNVQIFGELTIKGIRNTLSFPATIKHTTEGISATAKFKFDRTKWGIHYNSGKIFDDVGDGAISDAIALDVNLIANLK